MSVRFEMRLDDDLLRRIEDARGAVPRAAWIKLAIQEALEVPGSGPAQRAREALQKGEVAKRSGSSKGLPPVTGVKHVCPVAGCRASYMGPGVKCTTHDRLLVEEF